MPTVGDTLKIPHFDHDDTTFVVKEVTVLSGFIAAVGKLWSMYRHEQPKKPSLKQRVETMHADVAHLKSNVVEMREDHGFLSRSLTQILSELGDIRADQRQTRIALDNTQKTVTEILTMKREEQKEQKDKYKRERGE